MLPDGVANQTRTRVRVAGLLCVSYDPTRIFIVRSLYMAMGRLSDSRSYMRTFVRTAFSPTIAVAARESAVSLATTAQRRPHEWLGAYKPAR